MNSCLDQIEEDKEIYAIVLTSADEKKVHGEDGVCCGGCGGQ